MSEATTLAQVLAQVERLSQLVSQQQEVIARLEGQAVASQTTHAPITGSRRRLLRQLAGGLVAGVGLTAAFSSDAQAKFVGRNRAGAIIVSSNTVVSGALVSGTEYGLIVSSRPTLDLNTFSGRKAGVYGEGAEVGVYGYSYGVTDNIDNLAAVLGGAVGNGNRGVYGISDGDDSYGVYGSATGEKPTGVYGTASGFDNKGVVGIGTDDGSIGVYGDSTGAFLSWGGFFVGNVYASNNLLVAGSVSKGGGSFKIDHPLDPAHKYLSHSFVESPDMMNIYNGVVTLDEARQAVVELPEWFETLNRDFRYQLTALDQPGPNLYISQRVQEGRFEIAGGEPGLQVSWQLTGIRQDNWANAHRIPVEEVKPEGERGTYLHPELYGQSHEQALHFKRHMPRPASV